MKKLLLLLIIVSLFSCSKKDEQQVIEQSATYAGKCCTTPTLEEVLTENRFAPTESMGIRQLKIFNLDTYDSYNSITANNNQITIHCDTTGRELLIDWSGSEVTFTVTP